jgi:hypothetical protein
MSFQGQSAFGQGQQQAWRKKYTTAISAAANNGSGLIRITSNGHKLKTGDHCTIAAVVGTVEANAAWFITKIDGNNIDLIGSTFTNAYVSGGTITRG